MMTNLFKMTPYNISKQQRFGFLLYVIKAKKLVCDIMMHSVWKSIREKHALVRERASWERALLCPYLREGFNKEKMSQVKCTQRIVVHMQMTLYDFCNYVFILIILILCQSQTGYLRVTSHQREREIQRVNRDGVASSLTAITAASQFE